MCAAVVLLPPSTYKRNRHFIPGTKQDLDLMMAVMKIKIHQVGGSTASIFDLKSRGEDIHARTISDVEVHPWGRRSIPKNTRPGAERRAGLGKVRGLSQKIL